MVPKGRRMYIAETGCLSPAILIALCDDNSQLLGSQPNQNARDPQSVGLDRNPTVGGIAVCPDSTTPSTETNLETASCSVAKKGGDVE